MRKLDTSHVSTCCYNAAIIVLITLLNSHMRELVNAGLNCPHPTQLGAGNLIETGCQLNTRTTLCVCVSVCV